MPDEPILAERSFSALDQDSFAALSGDYNPMHVDPVAARRTPAGAPVVHGVHGLLWTLDQLASHENPGPLRAIDADFAQFLYVGETATTIVTRRNDTEWRVELRASGVRVAHYVLKLGQARAASDPVIDPAGIEYGDGATIPMSPDQAGMAEAAGTVSYAAADDMADRLFPALSAWIGVGRVTSILSLTRLVGMVSPGLHSTFHRLTIDLTVDRAEIGRLIFSTRLSDPRFGIVVMNVQADGILGTVKASRRQEPVGQKPMAAMRSLITAGGFTGHHALVVGGSRGLGEVTAKLLAAGGAAVTITYVSGAADAASVVDQIRSEGGRASSRRYDCMHPAAPQLGGLEAAPTSVYYFATPRISGRLASGFSAERFNQFNAVYVDGFHDLVTALSAGSQVTLQAFYPSTIFVGEPTQHMAEYAMSKAAGEALCAYLSRFDPRFEVVSERLPRLPTDQTASMVPQDVGSAESVMAAVVRRVEGRVRQSGDEARSSPSATSTA